MELAGLRVQIGLRTNGHAQYPNFNTLASVAAEEMDWTKYIDTKGKSWIYDGKSGHADDDPDTGKFNDSPVGTRIGIILAPVVFVTEAIEAFPEVCTRCTEAECSAFHDARNTHAMDEVEHDNAQLENLYYELKMLSWLETRFTSGSAKTKIESALTKLANRAVKALDEDDEDTAGIKKNNLKSWVNRKAKQKFSFIDP